MRERWRGASGDHSNRGARTHLANAAPIGQAHEMTFEEMVIEGTRALLKAIRKHHPRVIAAAVSSGRIDG